MTAMLFKDVQDAVIKDGFAEADRGDVKTWIVNRHAMLWSAREWVFRDGTTPVTFTANSQLVAGLPTDFLIATAVYNQQGSLLRPIRDIDRFFNDYNTNLAFGSSGPEAYTVIAGQLLVGPSGDGTNGLLVYERSKPSLVADTDPTGLPDGFDLALVYGAKAAGFALKNVPLSQNFENQYAGVIVAMENDYLTGIRGQVGQMGRYRPERSFTQWS